MTLENFQNLFENQKSSKKLFYKILCFLAIVGSLFILFTVLFNHKSKSLLFLAGWLLILGTYGFYELRKHYNLSYFENNFSEKQNVENIISVIQKIAKGKYIQNENLFTFVYQKSWWRMEYNVTIFSSENLIAINAEGRGSANSGFIDFGASKKIEEKMIYFLKNNPSL